ncbi:hypothetical protein [Arthrobacter sp. H14-L1]
MRASQVNRGAFCLDMHSREATSQGEAFAAWPCSPPGGST